MQESKKCSCKNGKDRRGRECKGCKGSGKKNVKKRPFKTRG